MKLFNGKKMKFIFIFAILLILICASIIQTREGKNKKKHKKLKNKNKNKLKKLQELVRQDNESTPSESDDQLMILGDNDDVNSFEYNREFGVNSRKTSPLNVLVVNKKISPKRYKKSNKYSELKKLRKRLKKKREMFNKIFDAKSYAFNLLRRK